MKLKIVFTVLAILGIGGLTVLGVSHVDIGKLVPAIGGAVDAVLALLAIFKRSA